MSRTRPSSAILGLLLLSFLSLGASFLHSTQQEPRESSSGGCMECGLLYKFCPADVGCGFADPSGVTCYCRDWTWCSDKPDCSATTTTTAVPSADSLLPVVLRPCNGSDYRQWILSMDPECSNHQEVVFSPRDENNDIFVLTQAITPLLNYSIFGAYVTKHQSPFIHIFSH